MGIKKYLIYIIAIILVWFFVLPFGLSKGLNVLCKNYSHNSDYEIEIANPKFIFSIIPNGNFKADKILLKSKKSNLEFDIEDFRIRIRLIPLLSGRLHINNVSANSLYLSTDIKEDLTLSTNFFDKLEKTKVRCDSVKIQEFNTILTSKNTKNPIKYTGSNLDFQKKAQYVKFKINSELNVDNKISKADVDIYLPKNNNIQNTVFDINISQINLSPFQIYFKHYLPKNLVKINGFVNIHANKSELTTDLTDCSVIFNPEYDSIIFPKNVKIISSFEIRKKHINFNNISVLANNINLEMDGKISDYLGRVRPTVDFNVRINQSKLEPLISLLPGFNIEEFNTHKLKEYKFYGDVLANLNIKGNISEPDIFGDVYITNGILTKPIPNTSHGATIKLNFTGRYIGFDVFVPAGGAQSVSVIGNQELYNIKYADMKIKSTESVDLHVAQTVVMPLHEILNFIIGPVPIMNISGKGNIDITVKGNRKNPHVWGILNSKDASVNFLDIPDLKLIKADSALIFNNQDATFYNKSGVVNGKDFKIKGICDLYGKFDFDVSSLEQPSEKLYKALQTSTIIPNLSSRLPKLTNISGTTDLNLKIFGEVKNIEDLEINKNTFAKGIINLNKNNVQYKNIPVKDINGYVKFDETSADANITALVNNSQSVLKSKIKNKEGNFNISIPKIDPNFIFDTKNHYLPTISLNGKYKGSIEDIDYDKIYMNIKILESNENSPFKFNSGIIELSGGRVYLKKLNGYINDKKNLFNSELKINNIFNQKPEINGFINLKVPNINLLNELFISDILPTEIRNYTKEYELQKGAINLNCKIVNNKIDLASNIDEVSFVYIPLELPIHVINGGISVKNNILHLNKINILADNMPILIDGDIKDIFNKKIFNLYLNSKPQQDFIDKFLNKNQIYPLKIKGDIVDKTILKGTLNNFEIQSNINMSKNSSIYYLGATVGDIENSIELDLNAKLQNKTNLKIKDFSYNKIIDSQNGKQTHLGMLKVAGGIEFLKDDIFFKDLKIKTQNPTDARIFNIIFKKPNIKQGQFVSDLKFNGKRSNPHVVGDFKISETNIPFWDTTMKNLEFIFKDKTIDISSRGEIMGSDINFEGVLKNKLTKPYHVEMASIFAKNVDLNYMADKIKSSQLENSSTVDSFDQLSLNSIVLNNIKLKADNITLRNLHATNFDSIASLRENGDFDVSHFKFNIANGNLSGKYKYNLKNNDTSLNLIGENISANDITIALFDLNNQIYGDLTGTLQLACNGQTYTHCMQTLSGNTVFNVKDGRMPKLGSLEYLLKAGNLIKGGVTGLSINSVIDLITPLKTGEFSDIYGSIRIKDGIARDVEITTKGKDLSLFVGGTYNFATSVADMEVLGLLSRKISTMFGSVGNLSINTLFNVIPGVDLSKNSQALDNINKIPGIELSSKAYRKFIAIIKGNINEDNYVTSFKWIN